MPQQTSTLDPVRKSVTVRLARHQAFELFTVRMHEWWPLAKFSIGQEKATTVVFEGRPGGRVYERTSEGAEHEWGIILAWEPPGRFAMTWHPGQPTERAQRVEVRFLAEGDGTRVDLTHDNWEARGDRAADYRAAYDGGWPGVLELFAARAAGTAS